MSDLRLDLLTSWLRQDLSRRVDRVEVASADASFRRYFRAYLPHGQSLIVMDAPPDREDIGPYLKVSGLLTEIGVHVPAIYAVDRTRGFMLMEDLGNVPYLMQLRAVGRAPVLYGAALHALERIQVHGCELSQQLALYDEPTLQREMALLPEWFLDRHLGLSLSAAEFELLTGTFEFLIAEAGAQPEVFVHRDYHSRNLMVLEHDTPGIIDFQDALRGPIGYDLVSLLKDCYVEWPRAEVERWLRDYRRQLQLAGFTRGAGASEREFLRWFDMIGVQRHLKVLGVFARLWWRDGKPGYLDDLPLTLRYVCDACARYVELQAFGRWLETTVAPRLPAATARARATTGPTDPYR